MFKFPEIVPGTVERERVTTRDTQGRKLWLITKLHIIAERLAAAPVQEDVLGRTATSFSAVQIRKSAALRETHDGTDYAVWLYSDSIVSYSDDLYDATAIPKEVDRRTIGCSVYAEPVDGPSGSEPMLMSSIEPVALTSDYEDLSPERHVIQPDTPEWSAALRALSYLQLNETRFPNAH